MSGEDWAKKDFVKPNMERFGAESSEWVASLQDLQAGEDEKCSRLLARIQISDPAALQSGRAASPREMYLDIQVCKTEPLLDLQFSWFNKRATRLPEALWLTFHPIAPNPNGWVLEKSGEPVSPFDVVRSANRHMHALSRGFGYRDERGSFSVETLDAPVVALGEKSPLYFSNSQPDFATGVHKSIQQRMGNKLHHVV